MTRDEILAMPAGRSMDALVAKHVFGCSVNLDFESEEPYCDCRGEMYGAHGDTDWNWTRKYSTDISAAWEVVDKFYSFRVCRYSGGERYNAYCVRYSDGREYEIDGSADADTPSLAICRAALICLCQDVV